MQSPNNRAVIAAAGSRKTQHIIDCVVANPSKRVLVTTYTNENLHQIVSRLSAGTGVLPRHVTVMGWFTFLLNECARPYQSFVLGEAGMMGRLNFVGQRSRYIPKSKPQQYYLDRGKSAYRDGVSAFSFEANKLSKGMVVDRLSRMYDHIFIDEIQDMAGYDLELLDLLMKSPISVTVVGDPRQATFATNNATKNSKYKGSGIVEWLATRTDLCLVENRVESYRCNQVICELFQSGHRWGDGDGGATHEAPVPLREVFEVSTRQRRCLVDPSSCRTRPPACAGRVGNHAHRHPRG
ncbi:UvrD-helicase domain-containing protein [Streptomyces sp. F41]|uniref:UvrD-helicase domain-containing protein n=1 Tax=Streptomyces sp. F41 TaxID=1795888 RepID=UPI0030CBE41B